MGQRRAFAWSLAAGLLLRGAAPLVLLFPGTIVASGAIAMMNVLLPSLVKRRRPDQAGALAGVMTVIAAQRANVIEISHDRSHYGANLGQAALDITLETRGRDHIDEIVAALAATGYRADRIV